MSNLSRKEREREVMDLTIQRLKVALDAQRDYVLRLEGSLKIDGSEWAYPNYGLRWAYQMLRPGPPSRDPRHLLEAERVLRAFSGLDDPLIAAAAYAEYAHALDELLELETRWKHLAK